MTATTAAATAPRRALWLVTAFVTGAVVMVLELVAFRLYAPYFGYSTYVWGSMIGVVMVALSAGYAIGGALADRTRNDRALYLAIIASALWQSVVLLTLTPLMTRLARMDAMLGPLVATFVIFAIPMTLLAITGPYVTRLLVRDEHVGKTAGNVSALSTVGSIVGVFGTSFALVPMIGTRATLILACTLTALTGLLGLALSRQKAAALALLPLLILPLSRPLGWMQGALWVRESAYNLVRVIRRGDELLLVLNDARTAQTVRQVEGRWSGHYQDYFALGPLMTDAQRVLVLGMGAGSSVETTRVTAPEANIDAVEIDPEVVEAARRFFRLREDARLHVHVADARPFVANAQGRYDLVQMDLFQGGLYQPFYLVTEEAFGDVRRHMTPNAVMMMNVYDGSPSRTLLNPMLATMRRVFPTVLVMRASRRNHLVLAFASRTSVDDVIARLRNANTRGYVRALVEDALDRINEPATPQGTLAFSDDHAPVESLTRRMIVETEAERERQRREGASR